MPAIKTLSPAEALAADHCTRCGDWHGRNGYVVVRVEDPSGDKNLRLRLVERVEDAPVKYQKHSYCYSCATVRQDELYKKDERSARNQEAKDRKRNIYDNDCTIIAIASATGVEYCRVLAEAKRRYNWKPNTGRGIANGIWPQLLAWAAGLKGKSAYTLDGGEIFDGDLGSVAYGFTSYDRGPKLTPAAIAKAFPKGKIAVSCSMNSRGHAMPIINGEIHNAGFFSGWERAEVIAAFIVR